MRHASHIVLPTIITGPGEYRTRCGETVTIDTVGRFATGRYSDGVPETWDVSGRLLPFNESKNDIVGN